MAIRNMKPTTNGQRGMSKLINSEITTNKPEKSLLEVTSKNAGRNNQGRITVRHQGGGEKRKYRKIDFKRNKLDIVGTVATAPEVSALDIVSSQKLLIEEEALEMIKEVLK